MNVSRRYILYLLVAVFSLHLIIGLLNEEYASTTRLSYVTAQLKALTNPGSAPNSIPSSKDQRANATILILARNSDLAGVISSLESFEAQFNSRFQYPYVFLNDAPFDETFRSNISALTQAKVEFGLIPAEDWLQPSWIGEYHRSYHFDILNSNPLIDEERAALGRTRMASQGVEYGGSLSYRNMCRFNSGFFFNHALMLKYQWYWRVEPNVKFHCTVDYDPFIYMEDNNKTYGFTISLDETPQTIPTLWQHVLGFKKSHPHRIARDNSLGFISSDKGKTYNACHFWSNFEIASMELWRSPAYTEFFDYLDATGGFYYERWGDAPVHSIAAALFLSKHQIHFFEEIGYQHNELVHCPLSIDTWVKGKCTCARETSFDYHDKSCLPIWDRFIQSPI